MKIVEEIEKLIIEIETGYPELYQYLDELPTAKDTANDVSEEDLKAYLEDLQQWLDHYKETH